MLTLILLLGGCAFARLWWKDLRAYVAGTPPGPGVLPGAVPCPARVIAIAALGGLVIVLGETWGELKLGIAAEQSTITVLMCAYTLVAAIIEEIIFRGFIVPAESRGRPTLLAGIGGASILFALAHPFLWQWGDAGFQLQLSLKGWFSTGTVFVASLWFYFVRFMPGNKLRSLWPCFAAHAMKNLGVIVIKAAQGFVVGWW